MQYAARVRRRFPRTVAGATVVDLDALAAQVCASVDEFPLSTGVLGCTVFEHGAAYTAIREGLRQDQPARYRFTLAHEVSEVLLHTYLKNIPDPSRHERLCDAFAAELLLPASVVRQAWPCCTRRVPRRFRLLSSSWRATSHAPTTFRLPRPASPSPAVCITPGTVPNCNIRHAKEGIWHKESTIHSGVQTWTPSKRRDSPS